MPANPFHAGHTQEGVSRKLLDRVTEYRKTYDVMEIPEETSRRIPQSEVRYYGTGVWEKAIAALGEAQPDADYWKATDGNAKKALVGLKAIADLALQAFPDERLTWEVE